MACAIVTGVGPGLGAALVRAFAATGLAVVPIARKQAVLDDVAHVIHGAGGRAMPMTLDAADTDALSAAVVKAVDELGPVAVAVHNAAALHPGAAIDTSPQLLVDDFRINVAAALALAQASVPSMREADGGTILFTGGGFATMPMVDWTSIGIGKAAIRHLGATLAQGLEPDGIVAGSVTIYGMIGEGEFGPERIADAYVGIHERRIALAKPVYEHVYGQAPSHG
ncbi:MAG: SDR family NAD(P)-dependent oxidoreductase [Sphingorhabdus sp.]